MDPAELKEHKEKLQQAEKDLYQAERDAGIYRRCPEQVKAFPGRFKKAQARIKQCQELVEYYQRKVSEGLLAAIDIKDEPEDEALTDPEEAEGNPDTVEAGGPDRDESFERLFGARPRTLVVHSPPSAPHHSGGRGVLHSPLKFAVHHQPPVAEENLDADVRDEIVPETGDEGEDDSLGGPDEEQPEQPLRFGEPDPVEPEQEGRLLIDLGPDRPDIMNDPNNDQLQQ